MAFRSGRRYSQLNCSLPKKNKQKHNTTHQTTGTTQPNRARVSTFLHGFAFQTRWFHVNVGLSMWAHSFCGIRSARFGNNIVSKVMEMYGIFAISIAEQLHPIARFKSGEMLLHLSVNQCIDRAFVNGTTVTLVGQRHSNSACPFRAQQHSQTSHETKGNASWFQTNVGFFVSFCFPVCLFEHIIIIIITIAAVSYRIHSVSRTKQSEKSATANP